MCPPADRRPEAPVPASGFGRVLWLVGWPFRMLLLGLVRLYQLSISPWLPATCRFSPTCSQYALLAIREYGAARGFVMSVWRILRCNPWGGHGYDPPRWFGEKRPASPQE